ncbi:MAG: hypothetical protein HN820_03215 [Candidatus Marinimicrobia bacterium]|nr:hypothetical protein [Candidatus Neomarinimicrobiota bacterium]MBT6871099.1 hypothetical protein [Candidatus Neomarinimicrobiota bacterium]MBT7377148.1 hypothetical protein [Candidatus Neomarinimicrobiota bacterium]
MIAVSQSGKYFQYLEWIPSEGGPLITKFGQIKSAEDFSFKNGNFTTILEEIINESSEASPRFQLSIDTQNIFISHTQYNSSDFIEWQKNQISDPEFETLYDTFSFPFFNSSSLLNIHLHKELKTGIVNSVQDVNGELRTINIGIFSAEIGAKQWFHAHQLESYSIWKMGKNHIDQLLIVKGGEFKTLVTFKRLKNSVKILNLVGSTTLLEKMTSQIESWMSEGLDEFMHMERLFVYSTELNAKDLKKLVESEIRNVTLLNPFEVLDISTEEKINPLKGATFAEMGVGFRGIDV